MPASAARDALQLRLGGMPAKSRPRVAARLFRICDQVPQNRGVFKSIEIINIPDNYQITEYFELIY
jgi:hypothetical protein